MIQCKDCELCEAGPNGKRIFRCDPFNNIKEPECIKMAVNPLRYAGGKLSGDAQMV